GRRGRRRFKRCRRGARPLPLRRQRQHRSQGDRLQEEPQVLDQAQPREPHPGGLHRGTVGHRGYRGAARRREGEAAGSDQRGRVGRCRPLPDPAGRPRVRADRLLRAGRPARVSRRVVRSRLARGRPRSSHARVDGPRTVRRRIGRLRTPDVGRLHRERTGARLPGHGGRHAARDCRLTGGTRDRAPDRLDSPRGGRMLRNRDAMIGLVLVVVGLLFILGQSFDLGGVAWPLFVIVPGLLLLGSAFLGKRESAQLAIPGAIVTTIGLVLFALAATDYWQAWSYCWALIIVGAGAGNFLYGALTNDHKRERDGLQTAYIGLGLFAAFGAFFEFLIFGDFGGILRWLLPIALIAGGAYPLIRRESPGS